MNAPPMRPLTLLSLLALSACSRCGKPTGPCSPSIAGTWRHADDPSYRFLVDDQGDRILVHPFRGDGGALRPARWGDQINQVVIDLERQPSQLIGVTRETGAFT